MHITHSHKLIALIIQKQFYDIYFQSRKSSKFIGSSLIESHSFSNFDELFFFLFSFQFLECASWIVVQYNKIPITYIESRKMITSIFSVVDILIILWWLKYKELLAYLINHVSSAFSIRVDSNSNLSQSAKLSENIVNFFRSNFVWQVTNIQNSIYLIKHQFETSENFQPTFWGKLQLELCLLSHCHGCGLEFLTELS